MSAFDINKGEQFYRNGTDHKVTVTYEFTAKTDTLQIKDSNGNLVAGVPKKDQTVDVTETVAAGVYWTCAEGSGKAELKAVT